MGDKSLEMRSVEVKFELWSRGDDRPFPINPLLPKSRQLTGVFKAEMEQIISDWWLQ